jgi:hypothetical protein
LGAKGLKKVENGEPDLYVGYSVTLGQPKGQAAAAPVAESSSWQTGSSWSAHYPSDKAARNGTLDVDIAELKKNLLAWKGSVMAEVGDSMNDARVKVSKGVSKAFAHYPPPAAKRAARGRSWHDVSRNSGDNRMIDRAET